MKLSPRRPHVGIALMLEPQFAQAAYPLFAEEAVDAVEWSFDCLWNGAPAPAWLEPLLKEYAEAGRLLGHGVGYSMFSASAEERSREWCARLRDECRRFRFHHITEHFGFMLAGDFHRGAPLPVQCTPEMLRLGRDRLKQLADAAELPIGLENLAFAFCKQDVEQQGAFLEELLNPVQGFLLLDLHNIHCQACNFGIDPQELLKAYPLNRVREVHLSGGSWSEAVGEMIRRDTHDGPVPEELFPLLHHALSVCPNVEAVILEQLGSAFGDEAADKQYRADFHRISQVTNDFASRQS